MVPGGTTDSIAHFIGYLHLFDDPSRNHHRLDGGASQVHVEGWSADQPHVDAPQRAFDDTASRPLVHDYRPEPSDLIKIGKHKLLPPPPISMPHVPHGDVPTNDPSLPDPGLPSPELVLSRFSSITIEVLGPAPQPDQLLANLKQVNVLSNDGVVVPGPLTQASAAAAEQHGSDSKALLAPLIDESQAHTPAWLPTSPQTQGLIASISTHDGDAASHHPPLPTVQPGEYIDGVAQPAGSSLNPIVPTPVDTIESSHNGMTNPGETAQTGGNTAVNIASIFDDHTQHTGFAVMGDVHTTDAIVQINVLQSLADIAVGGKAGALDISVDGNSAHNLASFAQHDTSGAFVSVGEPWGQLQVDTINGNFFDVKGFSQLNYISSNDFVAQDSTSAFSEVQSGHDTQINDLPFSELAQNYDLIVVGGSFHNTNIISQQNIFLNDDVVRMLSTRGDTASESVSTGNNTLENSASIDHYGATVYQPLGHDMAAWLADLEAGRLDAEGGVALPSSGSPLMHVLYIKGDFFDINYLSQTNIVSNADTVAQMMNGTGSDVAANGAKTTSTMMVDAGHNQLANLASIAVVGTTSGFQFLGGQHYDDSILIQADLVSDKATVAIGNTHALANELVAFTGLHDVLPQANEPVAVMPTDPTLHHDLFHGLLT